MADKNKKRRQQTGIHLIASDSYHNFNYQNCCKIVINRLQNLLFVEPINEEFKLISAMFKWKFYSQKNILFVFAEHDFQDFMLVFNNEVRSRNVYNLIFHKRAKDIVSNEVIYQRFLLPIYNQIMKIQNFTLSKLLLNWMNKLEFKYKEFYVKKMKDDGIFEWMYPNGEYVREENDESGERTERKRKFWRLNTSDNSEKEDLSDSQRTGKRHKFFKSNCEFKIVNIQGIKDLSKRLLVFTSKDKRFCYEYSRHFMKPNLFRCVGCKEKKVNIYAKLEQNEFLELQDKEHVCSKLQYSVEKYFDRQIFEKSNYEILENVNTKSGKILIIFNPNDRSQCYPCRRAISRTSFCCSICHAHIKFHNVSKENEYLEILKPNHNCKFRAYNPEKYLKFNKFVLAPNFEIQTEMKGETETKTLIIFDSNDKTKCYIYGFRSSPNVYGCKKCRAKRMHVTAKLLHNADGEDYIVLSNTEHVCETVKYIPHEKTEDIILRPPTFKLMEETSTGVPKLFLFDTNDKSLCYVFTKINVIKRLNQYECCGCKRFLQKCSRKNIEAPKTTVTIYLCKDENGEIYIQMKNQKHCCQLQKYEPEKYNKLVDPQIVEDYFYFRNKSYPKSVNVALLHPTDSTLCFPFSHLKERNYFQCLYCQRFKKVYRILAPKKDENGKEYFLHDPSKHVCKPKKIRSFQTMQYQRLQRKDLIFKEKLEKKIDENRILKLPNFEFRPSRHGNPEGTLVIFDLNDKSLCYEYYYLMKTKQYMCTKCQYMNHTVIAKVHFDDKKNEKFLELSEAEHICEPIQDEFASKVIPASKFIITDKDDETNPTKLIVFTSESKEFCYEFLKNPSKNCFQCVFCLKRKKTISVKLYKKESGEEYLFSMSKIEHICTPKKYDSKQCQPSQIIPESRFELHQNAKGESNKRLIVFTSDAKDFIYEYCFKKNEFYCSECLKQKKYVNAKLRGNDKKYLEVSKVEHVCKPLKFNQIFI